MKLFNNRQAENLERRLLDNLYDYADKITLRQTVDKNNHKAQNHVNMGLVAGLGVGALTVVGSIAMIPLAPAIATTAVIGSVTVAGVSLAAGSAMFAAGMSYAGLSKLYQKFQDMKLGDSYAQASEQHRMKMVDIKAEQKFRTTLYEASKGMKGPEGLEIYDIKNALKDNDMDAAKQIVKNMVNRVLDNKSESEKLFKDHVADNLGSKLNAFYEQYQHDATNLGMQRKTQKLDNKIFGGMALGFVSIVGGVAAAPLTGSALVVGLGVAAAYSAVTYAGINGLIKKHLNKKTQKDLDIKGDKIIEKYSEELNIDKSVLDIVKYKNNKTDFIEEAKQRVHLKI